MLVKKVLTYIPDHKELMGDTDLDMTFNWPDYILIFIVMTNKHPDIERYYHNRIHNIFQ